MALVHYADFDTERKYGYDLKSEEAPEVPFCISRKYKQLDWSKSNQALRKSRIEDYAAYMLDKEKEAAERKGASERKNAAEFEEVDGREEATGREAPGGLLFKMCASVGLISTGARAPVTNTCDDAVNQSIIDGVRKDVRDDVLDKTIQIMDPVQRCVEELDARLTLLALSQNAHATKQQATDVGLGDNLAPSELRVKGTIIEDEEVSEEDEEYEGDEECEEDEDEDEDEECEECEECEEYEEDEEDEEENTMYYTCHYTQSQKPEEDSDSDSTLDWKSKSKSKSGEWEVQGLDSDSD